MKVVDKACIVTAWCTDEEREAFCKAWDIVSWHPPDWMVFEHDPDRTGCGATKNRGITRALDLGFETVVVLDGDCYPSPATPTLEVLMAAHQKALEPKQVEMFRAVTTPASRGTPYAERNMEMPIAASMGFWFGVPDYCAIRQLAFEAKPMEFDRRPIYGQYFPLCGMNLAFRPREWLPWCQFIEVPRYDDIWTGWLWQREAYRRGYAFNLNGPIITHARQSNVWRNLIDEAKYAERTERLWRDIATWPSGEYGELLKLLPAGAERLSMEAFDRDVAEQSSILESLKRASAHRR